MSYPLCLCYAGSPSGHAMGAAARRNMEAKNPPTKNGEYLKAVLWTLFWGVQVCVCLSRVFIAAHFPHQVIAGVITGMIVAEAFNRTQWIYSASMKTLGVDLLWTLEKAQKWCVRPEWVHLDTTPFASCCVTWAPCSAWAWACTHLSTPRPRKSSSALVKAGCVISSLLLLHLFDSFKPPTHTGPLVLLLSFCKSPPVVTVSIIPYCVNGALSCRTKRECEQ
uniref:glucose-6-phosphatase n=1 Tax=Lates calcarifer TaxID=8187 RepID=A0A4W6CIC6_LATCA